MTHASRLAAALSVAGLAALAACATPPGRFGGDPGRGDRRRHLPTRTRPQPAPDVRVDLFDSGGGRGIDVGVAALWHGRRLDKA